ncbi:MAG: UDP-N-acetylmuramoyl-L-alanine--D-glutamate ligase [Patescibacteria group bacterium]|jgi:UDP-N-acetylmuramoylalanine--D-glutamate ligase
MSSQKNQIKKWLKNTGSARLKNTKSQNLAQSLRFLENKKIALLGFGLDNRALLSLLIKKRMNAAITICDLKDKKTLKKSLESVLIENNLKSTLKEIKSLNINYQAGKNFNKNLDKFDILFRSPGWPLSCSGIRTTQKKGRTEITSALNLFFELAPTKNIIGITGTKGKGTTATLIYKILRAAGRRAFIGGNIGVAPLSFLTKLKPADYVILELSSFQLEDLKYSPKIAVITNLFKEHLAPADPNNPNFHPSLSAYWRAKLNIASGKENKYLISNWTLKPRLKKIDLTRSWNQKLKPEKSNSKHKIIYFSSSSLPSKLNGDFNRENIGAAVAVAKILKIKPGVYKKTIAAFTNLEHRLELVAEINGVKYFDNSFSTTPESTTLDLKSFKAPLIQIAGGADKGADFKALAKTIKQKVKFLILLKGQATPRLKKEILKTGFAKQNITETDNMEKAVAIAKQKAVPDDIVLLSTACASFGLFKNYKERGNLFKKYVRTKK